MGVLLGIVWRKDQQIYRKQNPPQIPYQSSFTNEQCQDLLNILQNHLNKAKSQPTSSTKTTNKHVVDTTFSLSSSNPNTWIVDIGATTHICYSRDLFTSLKPNTNTTVSLPNQTKIFVQFTVSVKVNDNLTLYDVLIIRSFHFNLISLSSSLHKYSS